MKTVAIYSLKGGVGKSSLAVNLAFASAARSGYPTLLWDLDAQAASTFILGGDAAAPSARTAFARAAPASALVRPTATPNLDLLPADASLRDLDALFGAAGTTWSLLDLARPLAARYDRLLLDCPPGLTATSEQILRAADLIVVPVIPSPLSRRALDAVVAHLDRPGRTRGTILPVFNMVDRRRLLHTAALDAEPRWPVVPAASAVEMLAAHREPLFAFAPRSPAALAIDGLWTLVDRWLVRAEQRAAPAGAAA